MEPDNNLRKLALVRINDVRWWAGLNVLEDFPRGKPANACECPVSRALRGTGVGDVYACAFWMLNPTSAAAYAKALGGTVELQQDRFGTVTEVVRPPFEVGTFIAGFDMGDYPDLVEP